jgi:peptidoglycan hydrolase-like protein with peptidoglycan-binding domain
VALNSGILKGSAPNARLEQAAVGSPAIKPAPPDDDAEAIRRIQRGLLALGYPLPLSFPSGTSQPPDGKFGNETYQAVMKFQQKVFTGRAGEWDGRVGKNTLGRSGPMDLIKSLRYESSEDSTEMLLSYPISCAQTLTASTRTFATRWRKRAPWWSAISHQPAPSPTRVTMVGATQRTSNRPGSRLPLRG